MCIRDRNQALNEEDAFDVAGMETHGFKNRDVACFFHHDGSCLLYTSDAADERSSVDLGGRRIIKKKKRDEYGGRHSHNKQT